MRRKILGLLVLLLAGRCYDPGCPFRRSPSAEYLAELECGIAGVAR